MNMRSNGGKARLALAVLGAACCAAGCGDSGADNSEIEQYAHEVQRALSQPDCRTIERINKRSVAALGAFPDIPCPKPAKAKATLRDFDIEATTAYGPVAVVDYTSRKSRSGTSMLLVRGPRGGWTLNTFGIGRGISSDTDDTESRAGFDRTAKEYLRAIATRDCRRFYALAITRFDNRASACRFELPVQADFGDALAKTGRIEPEYLGGNAMFGFYGVETTKPVKAYRTITVVEARPGDANPYLVLNVALAPKPE